MKFLPEMSYLVTVNGELVALEEVMEKVVGIRTSVEEFDMNLMDLLEESRNFEPGHCVMYGLAGDYDLLITKERIHLIETKQSFMKPQYCLVRRQQEE